MGANENKCIPCHNFFLSLTKYSHSSSCHQYSIPPIHQVAAHEGHPQVVKLLLADPRVNPNAGSDSRATPLAAAAQQVGKARIYDCQGKGCCVCFLHIH